MNTKKQFTPIEVLEMTYNEANECLVFKLSDKVNGEWVDKFRSQQKTGGVHWSSSDAGVDAHLFEFSQNTAILPMSIDTYQSLSNIHSGALPPYPPSLERIRDSYFKSYLEKANLLYAEMLNNDEAQRGLTK